MVQLQKQVIGSCNPSELSARHLGAAQSVKVFTIPGGSGQTPCEPNTRKEAPQIAWVPVRLLPGWE